MISTQRFEELETGEINELSDPLEWLIACEEAQARAMTLRNEPINKFKRGEKPLAK